MEIFFIDRIKTFSFLDKGGLQWSYNNLVVKLKVFEMAGSVGEQTATVTTLSQPREPAASGDHWRVETEDAHGWLTHVIIIVILMNQCHR